MLFLAFLASIHALPDDLRGRVDTYEGDGFEPRQRCIYDDNGRPMPAICNNMDLADSWEHADNPQYPEKYSTLGFRIGVNYVIYSMSH
jgi:hypothetical protein